MRQILIAALLPLAACAPRLTQANAVGGTIEQSGSMGNDRAFALANAHCAKFSKVARVTQRDIWTHSKMFECVVP